MITPSPTANAQDVTDNGAVYVAGPIWAEPENDSFTAEVQFVGGHAVVAAVYGATRDDAERLQGTVLAALAASLNPYPLSHELSYALEPFAKVAANIAARPDDYGQKRLTSSGGLASAADLYPADFARLAAALSKVMAA